MSHHFQLGLQDAASSGIEELLYFHDYTIFFVLLISTFVLYIIAAMVTTKLTNKFILDSQEIETIWTLLPALILGFIAIPSIRILYIIDEISQPSLTIKTIGHQWYWSYEYTDYNSFNFDSYITSSQDLTPGYFRLLETDRRVVVPLKLSVRMLVSADDVLHSWAIPSLGVKIDAVPGRLNQTGFSVNRVGIFYGQCSEICGANHSFIPIVLEVVPQEYFKNWSALILENASLRSYEIKP